MRPASLDVASTNVLSVYRCLGQSFHGSTASIRLLFGNGFVVNLKPIVDWTFVATGAVLEVDDGKR